MKMQKALALCLALCLLISFSACQTEQDKKYDSLTQELASSTSVEQEAELGPQPGLDYMTPPTPGPDAVLRPAEGDALEGELLVKAFQQKYDQPEIYWLAREFMELHPNVTVKLLFDYKRGEQLSAEEHARRRDAFYSQVRVELGAGEADYLLYGGAERLSYYPLMENGFLEDLRPYWENDPDIHEEDYFTQVLDAFSVGGKWPVMPYSFKVRGAYFDRSLLAELDVDAASLSAVTADDILGWYEQARASRPDLQLFFTAPGKDVLFPLERARYIDLDSKEVSFDSPEFIDFLTRTRAVINDDPKLKPNSELGRGSGPLLDHALRYQATGEVSPYLEMGDEAFNYWVHMATLGRPSFASVDELEMYALLTMQQPLEYAAGPYLLTSTDGRLGVSARYDNFAMPSSLQNKELAWEFIKYCMGERENLTFDHYGYTGCGYYADGLPVNKANFAKMAEDAPAYLQGAEIMDYAGMEFESVDGEQLKEKMEALLSAAPVDMGKYNIDLQDYLDEFYINELTTPEQAAEKIQGRAYIWLNE